MKTALLQNLRQQRPLVVNYANFVTPGFVANGLNALGASPIMTLSSEEAPTLVSVANAVVINLGTINSRDQVLVDALANAASAADKPIILDPVAVGATAYRMDSAKRLLKNHQVGVIRGNASEISALVGVATAAKGIDAGTPTQDPITLATACANLYHCTVVVSGPQDAIADSEHTARVMTNVPLLPMIVGSGDLLSSLIGAFIGVTPTAFEAALLGCSTLAAAGTLAANGLIKTQAGLFTSRLLDALASLTVAQLDHVTKIEEG